MIRLTLARAGYRDDGARDQPVVRPFLLETVPVLAELARNGNFQAINEIASDRKQNRTVRLSCILALLVAGEPLRTNDLLEMPRASRLLEYRLIIFVSLGFAREAQEKIKLLKTEVTAFRKRLLKCEIELEILQQTARQVFGVASQSPSLKPFGRYRKRARRCE